MKTTTWQQLLVQWICASWLLFIGTKYILEGDSKAERKYLKVLLAQA